MKSFKLYSASECHLCDLAQGMLEESQAGGSDIAWEKVDIRANGELNERYGLSIPVLAHPDARELGWPFSPAQLRRFLAS
ncbi:MAG: hypothetical protein ACI9JM_000922 [Halioglobus sp.]